MRVLHTIASLDPATGGPARSVPALVKYLKKAGVAPVVWSAAEPESEWIMNLGQAEIEVRSGRLENASDYDVVHDHGLWLSTNHTVARLASRDLVPRIVSPRGMLEPWALNHKKWKKRLAWWLYQHRDLRAADALHATAPSEAEQLRKLGLLNPIHVIPNGVDIPLTASEGEKVKGQRSESRQGTTDKQWTNDGRRTALFLSRIHPKKGLPMLIEAWARIRPAGWRMRVVGPDEAGHRAELEALVTKSGLCDDWEFSGALDGTAKENAFREAELFILPTYSENFGIAVAEALAAGIPVITTTGAPWKGLERERAGWWVPPAMDAIAEALQQACTADAITLQKMGARGRAWVEREYSWEGVAKQMIESYESMLHERQ